MSTAYAHTTTTICTAVRTCLPQLQAATRAIDRDRRVRGEVLAALRAAGVDRMLVPTALGGTPVDLQGCLEVIETVAEGNSAAGWNLATSAWGTLHSLVLPHEGAAQIYAHGPDVRFAGGGSVLKVEID